MASNSEHTNSGQPVKPLPSQIPIHQLLNPLWAMQEIQTAPITIPPKTDKTRTAAKTFSYPSSVQDINKDTMLPLPRGWLYLDMNIALENVTEPNVAAAFMDDNAAYPMLTASYNAPEILQRIFNTPTDPEYNKFTQQVYAKADMRDLVQLAALHEIKHSYAAFVVMEDKHGDNAKAHLSNIQTNYRVLDVHAQQHILQILAPPPNDKIVTHYSATAKYPGEDEATDWKFIRSPQGRSYIGDMVDFWKKAEAANYVPMRFPSNEKLNNDTSMEDDASGQDTDGEDTPIITMMQQGGAALQNNNNLAETMTTEAGKDTSASKAATNKTQEKQNEGKTDENILYVPKAPAQLIPSYIIRSQSDQYEQHRRRQLEIEEVVDRLYDANQFDESKYTAVCQQWHKEQQYTIQQVEEDLKQDKFKKVNIEKKKKQEEKKRQEEEKKRQEQEKKKKHVHFGGSRFGQRNNNTQYVHQPPNPSFIPNRHSYTKYNNANNGVPGQQPPPNGNPPGNNPNGNANNTNTNPGYGSGYGSGYGAYGAGYGTGYGGQYGAGYYSNDPNYKFNPNTAYYSMSDPRYQPQPHPYNNNRGGQAPGANDEEKATPEQLMKQLKEAQQELQRLRQGKFDSIYNSNNKTKRNATVAQQQQQQLNQQFENIARKHLPKEKQHTFNNPSNEEQLAGSIAAMLNGNQLPPRQHTNTLPSDPVAALPTPIPPGTAMDHRYPTMRDNNNDIFNFSIDNVNQIDNYINDFDYNLNATVTQRAVPTAQSIAINTSLV